MTKDQLLDLLKSAVAESDSAAHDFENAGEHTYGDVPNGLINFHRSIGRAQVALARAEIDMLKVRVELAAAPDLLAAAIEARRAFVKGDDLATAQGKLVAAIAKATGGVA